MLGVTRQAQRRLSTKGQRVEAADFLFRLEVFEKMF